MNNNKVIVNALNYHVCVSNLYVYYHDLNGFCAFIYFYVYYKKTDFFLYLSIEYLYTVKTENIRSLIHFAIMQSFISYKFCFRRYYVSYTKIISNYLEYTKTVPTYLLCICLALYSFIRSFLKNVFEYINTIRIREGGRVY